MKLIPAISAAFLLSIVPARADDWPMWGGRPDRNQVSAEKNLPSTWNGKTKEGVKWVAELGEQTLGNPVVAGGRVFIGTNGGKVDKGVLMCFNAADGALLWKAVHDKLPTGDAEDWKGIGICSTPCVVGEKVYYVSNRAELVCCDVKGDPATKTSKPLWTLDMRRELGVRPYQASASSPIVVGDLVFVITGHGIDAKKLKVLNPKVPSFIAVNKDSGKVVWQDNSPGSKIIAGQWSSPAYGTVDGAPQVVFPGGDGWLYSFEPATGKPIWKFNTRVHEKPDPDKDPEIHLVATPVFTGHRVIIATGMDPEGGARPGCLRAIDARKQGDVTTTAELWKLVGEDFGVSVSSVAVQDGLVYAVEFAGMLNCIELETGKRLWKHDLKSTTWGSPLIADGKLYLRNGDGEVLIYQPGRELKTPTVNGSLEHLANGTVVAVDGVLYIAGESNLYAVGK